MVVDVNNLRDLISSVANDANTYAGLVSHFDFLMQERIKLTQNSLRTLIGRPEQKIDKENIIQSVKKINTIAAAHGANFHIEEDWENIEAFLRLSVMEDVAKEFKKQETV